ncbi:hypothetical protein MSAN_02313900 [Mycena sanguinolenta]|uniref:DUF6533 domain-containing protein n=1 Tax=Mycena sanguinolenta TaxID=230812 RepID=A0A8H6X7R8_9AGAR|nr:hypothetical protein MSAN_02313900 [Mycena sanguinolenta]
MATTTELPNPFTPLAFLPPALASEFEVSRYLYAATLGAYVWDIGLNLGNDYTLLFKHKIRFPTIVYFLSRVFTLGFILLSFFFAVASIKNCNALALGGSVCFVLFWHPSKIAYVVFSIFWIAYVGAGITVIVGVRAAHIGPTMLCTITSFSANLEIVGVVALMNDTAIFFAISYRILAHTIVAKSLMARCRVFFGGTGLSTLSQALLESGQNFYL